MAAVTVTNGNGIIIIDDGNSEINAAKELVTVTAYYNKVRIQYGETYYVEFFYYEFISPSGNSAREVADIIAEYVFQPTITAVENYSALPTASSVAGLYYFCKNSQGTAWLPWSLGGTYYPAGTYYSDGATWIYGIDPSEAGQVNTDAGIITDRFVSPATLNNYSGWNKTKVGLSNVDNTSDLDKPISTATQTAINEVEANAVAYSIALGGI